MRMLPSAKRRLANEAGFTLAEVLVTILMMSLVVMALYSMFDMSLRVFSTGNSTAETNQNARVALDRMEREIRSAWPLESDNCSSATAGEVLDDSSNNEYIEFKNCLPDYSTPDTSDAILTTINYGTAVNGAGEVVLQRGSQTPAAPSPKIETLATLGEAETPLQFCYLTGLETDSSECPMPSTDTALVEVTLTANDGDQTQTLITNAGLRNAN